MDINSYLYTGNYSNNSISSLLASQKSRNVQYRGGVTGWEQKATSSNASSSSSGVSSEAASYLTSVKEFGTKLNSAMNTLMGGGKTASIFDSLGASSTDTDAMSVSITDQAKAKDFLEAGGEKSVEVFQVAKAQQNKSTSLSASATNTMNRGKNSFTMETGGKSYSFEVNMNGTETNRTAQQKVADAINAQNTGVKATVDYNEKNNTSRLVLTSNETGVENGFSIEDEGTSNAISRLGANTTTTAAQDAEYSVDGWDLTSASNEVDLGDGLKAKFKDTTEEAATVSAGQNATGITNAIYEMVNGYNQLRETALSMEGDSNADRLTERLDSVTSAYKNTLETIGVTTNSSGYMDLDKEVMNTAIENGDAQKALSGDSSLAKSLSTVSAQAKDDPGRFLSYQAKTAADEESAASSMEDYLSQQEYSFSPYQAMQMNQWQTVGMLFNMTA